MMRPWIKFLAPVSLLLLLACGHPVSGVKSEPIDLPVSPSWRAVADRLEVVVPQDLIMPDTKISSLIFEQPSETLKRWVRARIATDKSTRGLIVATIQKAEMRELSLPRKQGFSSIFEANPNTKLSVNFAISLKAIDSENREVGRVNVDVQVTSEFVDDDGGEKKRSYWMRLLRSAVDNLDAELARQLPTGFPDFERLN
jgi:hypothetical protein